MEEIIVKIMEFIANPQVLLIAGVVVEFALRFAKTEKPMSIIRGVAVAMRSIGKVLIAVADFSDKILPNRLK